MTRSQASRYGLNGEHQQQDRATGDSSATQTGSAESTPPRSLRRLTCLSVTYRTHSTELVGRLGPSDPVDTARTVYENDRVTEAMVLSTCNRLEVYVSTRTPDAEDCKAAMSTIRETLDLPSDARTYRGQAAVAHLARVTAGLESAVLGEDEIAGQVSDALAGSKEEGLAAGVLGRAGNTALRAGRACRAETAINEGPADYGSAVCRTLIDELEDTPDRVLVIGAGTMARTVVEAATCRWEVRVDVANRSPAQELPTDDGAWWTLDELSTAVRQADAVVTATGADQSVFELTHAEQCQEGTPVVDLAAPADVAESVTTDSDVSVISLDRLASTVASAAGTRQAAVDEAEMLITEAVDRLVERERENRAEDVIRALHREASRVREAELDKAKRRLSEGDAEPEEILEDMASALTGQLLGPATDELRTAARERDETALRAARRLFDLKEVSADD